MGTRLTGLAQVEVITREAWRAWLAAHYAQDESVWCVTYKAGASKPRVGYDDLVEEALCFGWIDSAVRRLDAERTMLLMSPRRDKSAWSAINKARVDKLLAAGMMTPAGLAKVESAKASGLWTKLDAVEALTVPDDLAGAFRDHPGAEANWLSFPRSTKRGILEWIEQAKKPETRAARVMETAAKAAQNIRANQWRRPSP
jgi:uncharacterized protein YdeI (YjbR/CyaY-like superfamily)